MSAPIVSGVSGLGERDWLAWARERSWPLGIGLAAVVLLPAAAWLQLTSARRKEAFAAQALVQARTSVEVGNLPLAASDLARLVDRFGGTRAAEQATILLGQIRLVQGQTDSAVGGLETFLRSRRPDYVRASALALLAAALEQQGKMREAGDAYRRAAAAEPQDFLKAEYLTDAGRTLAAGGDTAAARDAYAQVLAQYGELVQSREARVRMAEIGGTVPPPTPGPRRNQAPGSQAG